MEYAKALGNYVHSQILPDCPRARLWTSTLRRTIETGGEPAMSAAVLLTAVLQKYLSVCDCVRLCMHTCMFVYVTTHLSARMKHAKSQDAQVAILKARYERPKASLVVNVIC